MTAWVAEGDIDWLAVLPCDTVAYCEAVCEGVAICDAVCVPVADPVCVRLGVALSRHEQAYTEMCVIGGAAPGSPQKGG